MAATSLKPSRPTRQHGPAFRIGWFVGRLIVWFLALSVGWTLIYAVAPVPITMTMLTDPNGFTRDWTPLSEIDRDMIDAAIAGEDGKFCAHDGFDRAAIERAARKNVAGKRLRGGSTISQQTAKNAFLWQGRGWSRYVRKGFEAWFTLLIENIWGKRRIMEVYLNVAETGIGTYGAEAGAQRYYHHSAARLGRTEAARIAAVLPLPKARGAVDPAGFTRRYGNTIAARIGQVRRDALDACVYD